MKAKSFSTRIILSSAVVFVVCLSIIIGYNAKSRLNEETEIALKNSALITENLINDITKNIDYTFDVMRVQNNHLIVTKNKIDRNTVNEILTTSLKSNPDFFGTYTLWEPNAFDGKDKDYINQAGYDKTGRFIPYWTRKSADELRLDALTDYETEGTGDYYQKPKKTKKECIIDPYYYTVGDRSVLMISIVSPIMINGEFQGISGVDYEVGFVQNELLSLQKKIYDGKSNIEIFSNQGKIVGSTILADSVGKSIVDLEFENAEGMIKKIQRGKSETKVIGDNLVITKSFRFGKTDTPWQVRITIPYSEIIKQGKDAIMYSVITGIFLLIIGLLIIFILVRRLTKPLNQLVESANKIALGDLTGKITILRNDEIGLLGNSFNKMIDKLKEIITVVIESANSLTVGTSQIATSSQQIAQGATEQAASAEEVSASIEQMTSNIEQNSENALQTERISREGAIGIMEVATAAQKSVEAIKKIADKITVVNEIAEKTDILAINAAIEAARAGEHGKGFAVVAAEVRKLAEISQTAAKEINELSKLNLQLTMDAGELMGKIIPNIQKTAQLVGEISASSAEQNLGAQQIAKAVDQLSTVTQQNSASSEELSSSSEELASQAEVLKDTIMFFKIEQMDYNTIMNVKKQGEIQKNNVVPQKKSTVTINLDDKDTKVDEFENF